MKKFTLNRRQVIAAIGGATVSTLLPFRAAEAQGTKTLITCVPVDPPTLNTTMSSNIESLIVTTPAYSWLVKVLADGSIEPDLAEDWSISDDGKEYTFRLRSGVKWHDGKPFTASDAQFTINEMISKFQPMGKNAYLNLEEVEVPDDNTLIVRFTQPNLPYLNIPYALGPILPRHLWEGTDFVKNPHDMAPVGTGPFRFVEHRIGEAIEYAANDSYYGGKPGVDRLIFRVIPDPVSRAAAFENGELDTIVASQVPLNEIDSISARPNVTTKIANINGPAYIGIINTKSGPYGDVRVRKALAHAIDRGFIRDNIIGSIAQAMVGPVLPYSPLYNADLVDYDFDIAMANKLLDEAGFMPDSDGIRFQFRLMWQNSQTVTQRMGEVISQNLKAVGIETVLMPMESSAVVQLGYIDGGFDMIINVYGLGPDPEVGVERLYNSNNILERPYVNNSSYSNPEVDRLFDEQRLATTFEERKAIYDQIQSLIWDDVPVLPISAYDVIAFENNENVSDVYQAWSLFVEDFSNAKVL